MALFELHACQNGSWRCLDDFQDKDTALSRAFHLEQAKRYSALKIINETFDDEQKTFNQKLIYSWSEEREQKAKDRELEKYLERLSGKRKKKSPGNETAESSSKEKIENIILKYCVIVLVIITISSLFVLWNA